MVLDSSKLVSVSVRGISNFRKRRTIFTWCGTKKRKADIYFLRETHLKKDTGRQWKNEGRGEVIMSHESL